MTIRTKCALPPLSCQVRKQLSVTSRDNAVRGGMHRTWTPGGTSILPVWGALGQPSSRGLCVDSCRMMGAGQVEPGGWCQVEGGEVRYPATGGVLSHLALYTWLTWMVTTTVIVYLNSKTTTKLALRESWLYAVTPRELYYLILTACMRKIPVLILFHKRECRSTIK